jgi:hypothetical protein
MAVSVFAISTMHDVCRDENAHSTAALPGGLQVFGA